MSELAVKRLLLQTPAFAHGAPGVTPWPPEPLDYIFQEGVASPYNAMYDYIGNLGSPVIIDATEDIGVLNLSRACTHTSDGTLYVTYCKNLAGVSQIYIKKSVDDGVTWTDETLLSTYAGMNGQTQHWPCIAVDSDDHLHVVWHGQATGYTTGTQIWYAKGVSPYEAADWVTPIRISDYTDMEDYAQYNPSVAVDSSDYIHVIWRGRTTGYLDFYKIWYAVYTDSWATPECLQPVGQSTLGNLRWSRWPR